MDISVALCTITRLKMVNIYVLFSLGSHVVRAEALINEGTKQQYNPCSTEGGSKITKPTATNRKGKIMHNN